VLTEFICDALGQVTAEMVWPWLRFTETVSVAALATSYNMAGLTRRPASILSVVFPGIDEAYEVAYSDLANWTNLSPVRRQIVWARQAELLHFQPPAGTGTTITITYVADEADLVNGTDVPLMPAAYRRTVVELATSLACDTVADDKGSARFMARYQTRLAQMKRHAFGGGRAPHRIRVRAGGGL
jgi:hypothetical protein